VITLTALRFAAAASLPVDDNVEEFDDEDDDEEEVEEVEETEGGRLSGIDSNRFVAMPCD
jgi:hypothetical protein